MSRLGGNDVKSPLGELYEVPGRIFGGGTGPTAALTKGCSFVRGGTGTYTILPDVNYPFIASGPAILVTTAGKQVAVSAYYNGGPTGSSGAGATAYVTYQVTTGGVTAGGPGAAVDLVAAEELWFSLAFVRSVRP